MADETKKIPHGFGMKEQAVTASDTRRSELHPSARTVSWETSSGQPLLALATTIGALTNGQNSANLGSLNPSPSLFSQGNNNKTNNGQQGTTIWQRIAQNAAANQPKPSLPTTTNIFPPPAPVTENVSSLHYASESKPRMATNFSTLGFGIDNGKNTKGEWDATEAAVHALREAMDRSSLSSGQHDGAQVHIKLGVPTAPNSLTQTPISVDMGRLASVLPNSVTILSISCVVGGLIVPSPEDRKDSSICSVVAALTIQRVEKNEATAQLPTTSPVLVPVVPPMAPPTIQRPSCSMDVLARISASVREQDLKSQALKKEAASSAPAPSPVDAPPPAKRARRHHAPPAVAATPIPSSPPSTHSFTPKRNRPGVTAKNRVRQFVQHNYSDHAYELPTNEDGAMVLAGKSYNAAFPIKLHEVLTQVEEQGLAHIFGWLSHGRAFKIHEQEAFVDMLPQFFAMRKKSSFLRQLNLYGFHRLSAGPDKGAYYHELFLKGMGFLARRITRVKVNGNGIRASANPDDEPQFYKMAPVPLAKYANGYPTLTGKTDPANSYATTTRNPKRVSSKDTDESSTEDDNSSRSSSDDSLNHQGKTKPVSSSTADGFSNNSPIIGNSISFPLKLHSFLDSLEAAGEGEGIVGWLPHGRAFVVHDPVAFAKGLMPIYLGQHQYSSFQRQLHLYSFQRITAGRDKGAYYNDNFLRGKPRLCMNMGRTRVNGKGTRQKSNPEAEPDLWALEPMPPAVPTVDIKSDGGVSSS